MPWEFGVPFQLWESTDILRGSVFTDRGVYKPGEPIHVKAIVRSDTPNGIRLLPAGSTLDVRIHDSRNKEVDRRTITINRWSSAEWEWTVPAEATLGNYRIQALVPGSEAPEGNDVTTRRRTGEWLKRVHGSFLVAAYRKPDFRVDTTLDAKPAVAGATLNATASARYLFGNAMARRPVKWTLTREPDMTIPSPILERYPDDQYVVRLLPATREPWRRTRRRRDGGAHGGWHIRDRSADRALGRLRLSLQVRGGRRGHLPPAHRESVERRRASRALAHRPAAPGVVRRHEDRHGRGRRRGRSGRESGGGNPCPRVGRSRSVELRPSRRRQRVLHVGHRTPRGSRRRVDGDDDDTFR